MSALLSPSLPAVRPWYTTRSTAGNTRLPIRYACNLFRGRCCTQIRSHQQNDNDGRDMSRNSRVAAAVIAAALVAAVSADSALAKRPDGVNRPELLPPTFTRVIDTAGFLSQGQVRESEFLPALALSFRGAEIVGGERIVQEERLGQDLERLEADTGFKLRLLAQNYPQTPGLAIKEFWGVDDNTIVFVADPSLGGDLPLST